METPHTTRIEDLTTGDRFRLGDIVIGGGDHHATVEGTHGYIDKPEITVWYAFDNVDDGHGMATFPPSLTVTLR